jgi:hypothetical protein
MIESVCPTCGNKKVFEDDKLGKKYKCPSCSTTVEIEKVNVTLTMQDEVVLETEDVRKNMNAIDRWIYNLPKNDNILGAIAVIGFFIWYGLFQGIKSLFGWYEANTFGAIWFTGGFVLFMYKFWSKIGK